MSGILIGAVDLDAPDQARDALALATWLADMTRSELLLVTIFAPGTPLHDGAVILSGQRVAAAGCFLPLSLKDGLSKRFGTRHRAAMGITEETDALAIVVSEERGTISVARDGDLTEDLDGKSLRDLLLRESATAA